MSYSELKAFDKDGNVVCLEEFRNSHYIPVIWDVLAKKYGILERMEREAAEKDGFDIDAMPPAMRKNYHYQVRGRLMLDMSPVWDIQKDPAIDEDDFRVLMFTFDNAVIAPDDIEAFAAAFENFTGVAEGVVNHGAGFAACMRKALEDIPGIRGIALYSTSVCEDPWGSVELPLEKCQDCGGPVTVEPGVGPVCKNEACETEWLEHDRRPYNLDQDDKHWFIPSKEEHQKEEADGA